MVCKGICSRYKAQKPKGVGRYASGQRRCQLCEIFINWEGRWCPCCGYRLRTRPRNIKYKTKLQNTVYKVGAIVLINEKPVTLIKYVSLSEKGQIWSAKTRENDLIQITV